MTKPEPTQQPQAQHLYDQTASRWSRQQPSSLSDYTARPRVMELCAPVAGLRVLDLGCGEGYVSRMLRQAGAASVLGLDVSPRMIDLARQAEAAQPLGIRYDTADAAQLDSAAGPFDLVVAVFLFNYLDVDAMRQTMTRVRQALVPGGRFIFTVPHPAFAFMRAPTPPFYFEVGSAGYFTDRNTIFPGKIWKRDGTPLEVQLVHKTFGDYFQALRAAGFETMPEVEELSVTSSMVELDPVFFGPLFNYPLHMAVRIAS
ncbi:MAG TPA: class I SAM-dependent methyltransferase [Rhizobacter sp.]|nr:class I SAM-dependent methyltransferase [Rhizobacter sp.]